MYTSTKTAERIKELAKERGVSVRQVLLSTGLNYNTMANMKTSMPKADNLARIADYLDCSVDYLLGRTDTSAMTKTPTLEVLGNGREETDDLSEQLRKLAEIWEQIPPESRPVVTAFLETAAAKFQEPFAAAQEATG